MKMETKSLVYKSSFLREFSGELTQEGEESHEHRFFSRHQLPTLNSHQERFIMDWVTREQTPIIK